MVHRVDLVLDDYDVILQNDQDVDVPPFPTDLNVVQVEVVCVENGAVEGLAFREDVPQQLSQHDVLEPMVFTWVENVGDEIGVPEFLPLDGECSEDIRFPQREFKFLEVVVGYYLCALSVHVFLW